MVNLSIENHHWQYIEVNAKGYGVAIAKTHTWEGGGPRDAVNCFFFYLYI